MKTLIEVLKAVAAGVMLAALRQTWLTVAARLRRLRRKDRFCEHYADCVDVKTIRW